MSNEMKNCMFQYATEHQVIEDTGLISMDEALALFDKYKEHFKHDLDESPEMALWINCKDSSTYSEYLHYWLADEFVNIDGYLYQRVC